jgi:peptidoglycan/LPS O-acetylase OafA/YrhL
VTTAAPRTTPSGDQAAPSGEFRTLTGLRIVAAVWVVVFHFHFTPLPVVARVAGWFGPLITQGALGVDLFFVLSGFVIAFTYLDKLGPALRVRSTARFVWARVSRMWPVYVLVFHLFGLWLVARLAFGSGGDIAYQTVQPVVSVGEWAQQLFMVQMWDNPFLDGASWVGSTWSLSAEWLAYLVFPVTALGFFRLRRLPAAVLALGALALMTPIAWAYLLTGSPYFPWSWAVRVLCGFSAGVLAYLTVRRLRADGSMRRRASGVAAAVPLVIAAGLVLGEIAGPGRGGVVIVLFPVLVGALALADRGPATLLARPLMVSGGRISFSLYLVHIPIFEMFWTALRHFPVTGRPACFVALIVLLSTVVVAGIAYHLVEEPARRRMRRIALPARDVASATSAADARAALALDLVAASRAAAALPGFVPPVPRPAATSERRPNPAGPLLQAQRARPAHRAALAAALDRAELARGV